MIKPWMLLAMALILDTIGTVLFKQGTNKIAPTEKTGVHGHIDNIFNALKRKEITLGVIVYILEYTIWIAYISTTPLNVAFSLSSLNVILVLLASAYFLKEQVSRRRWLGASCIVIGVYLVGSQT